MNIVDIVIIGSVVLLAVVGMMSGLLKPASGIGGLILGVILAVNYQAQAATLLVPYVDSDIMRRIAAFVGIVLTAAVATRVFAGLFKKLLSTLVLGWVDHVAGAVAGAALGTVLVGTIIYVVTGADLGPTRTALAASQFASDISRASLVVADTPWCSEGVESTDGEACTDLKGLFSQVLGRHMPVQVDEIMGQDMGALADVVKGALTGNTGDLLRAVGAEDFAINPTSIANAIGAENIVNAIGAENIVNAIGVENIVNAVGAEDIVNAVGVGDIVNAIGVEDIVNAVGVEDIVNAVGVEDIVNAVGVEDTVNEDDQAADGSSAP